MPDSDITAEEFCEQLERDARWLRMNSTSPSIPRIADNIAQAAAHLRRLEAGEVSEAMVEAACIAADWHWKGHTFSGDRERMRKALTAARAVKGGDK